MAKDYNNESIKRLKGPDTVRQKVQMYFGTDSIEGCYHTCLEILANSIDEAREGYGNEIWFTVHKDNSYTVKDNGRGLPMAFNKVEKEYNYKLTLETLHAGGKMDNTAADANYENSLGTNGVGATATNFASKWFKAESHRDGKIYTIGYEKGIETTKYKEEKDPKGKSQKTGTIISWLPDLEVFTDIVVDKIEFENLLRDQSIINKGLKFHFKDERDGTSKDFYYPEGILGYAKEQTKDDRFGEPLYIEFSGSGKDKVDKPTYKVKGELTLVFSNSITETKYYHNASFLKYGGSPSKALNRALLSFFTEALKKANRLNKKFEVNDVLESIYFISNTSSTKTSYEGQTKFAIKNQFIEDLITANIEKMLKEWQKSYPNESNRVIEQVAINCESRLTSASAKQLSKEKLSAKAGLSNKIDKLTECRTKDNTKNEVFIVEGDSAAGTIRNARNPEYQAVYALRGKPNNVHKIGLSKLLENEGILNMFKVFGTGITVPDKKSNKIGEFNLDARRFSKYIIASDQDLDGLHIACLIITIVFDYMPELINKGYLYRLETPLYIVKTPDGDKYCYSDAEKDKILKQYGNKVKRINRYKGLGEFNKDQFAVLLKPENRKLTKYTVKDVKEAQKVIDLWMGNDSDVRKKYIAEHSKEYKDIEIGSEG